MRIHSEDFDTRVSDWLDWGDAAWGRLYYTLLRANLAEQVVRAFPSVPDDRPLRMLDIGGGYGADTFHFAAQGFQVTMLDYSPAMLDEARRRAAQLGLASRIEFVQFDVDCLADDPTPSLPGAPFDLALCHLMVQFTSRPLEVLRHVPRLLAPGGLFSLIETNRYSEAYRRAFQPGLDGSAGDYATAFETAAGVIGITDYLHPWFDRYTPVYAAQEMIDLLQASGLRLAGHYGIRCLCDYLPNEPKADPQAFARLEALERRLSAEYPYYLLARFYHLVAQKPTERESKP